MLWVVWKTAHHFSGKSSSWIMKSSKTLNISACRTDIAHDATFASKSTHFTTRAQQKHRENDNHETFQESNGKDDGQTAKRLNFKS